MAFRVASQCVGMKARANIQMQKAGAELVCEYDALLPASDLERWEDCKLDCRPLRVAVDFGQQRRLLPGLYFTQRSSNVK